MARENEERVVGADVEGTREREVIAVTKSYKKTDQINLRPFLRYCLTALCLGSILYPCFSQSVTGIGLLATVSDRRRPEVSALPLGSKY